jgi:hypothetical protein
MADDQAGGRLVADLCGNRGHFQISLTMDTYSQGHAWGNKASPSSESKDSLASSAHRVRLAV